MDNFKCTVCGKMFSRKDNLQRHIKTHATTSMTPSAAVVSAVSTTTTSMTTFNCTTCGMTFSRLDNLKRHNAHVHSVSVNNNPPTSSPPPPPQAPTTVPTIANSIPLPANVSSPQPKVNKPSYIWTKSPSDIRDYYRYNGGHYICPTCLMAHKNFGHFVDTHRHHAGQFTQSKAATFDLCTIIKSEDDDDSVMMSEEIKKVSVKEEEEEEFYIWSDLDDARNYYKHRRHFLCPQCDTYTANFDEFVDKHRSHAKAFLRPKSTYSKPPPRPSSINTSQSSQHSTTTTTMKRQYGGAMERIRVSHRSSLRNCHTTIEALVLEDDVISMRDFIGQHRDRLMLEFNRRLQPNIDYKVQMTLLCDYHRIIKKAGEDDVEETKEWYVSNAAVPFSSTSGDFMVDGASRLDEKMAAYSSHGSNWVIRKIVKVGFVFTRHEDMCRVAGHSYIPTPPALVNSKKGIVNPRNTQDNLCFLYALLAVVKYDQVDSNRERVSNYAEFLEELVYDEDIMPMKLANVSKFERQNPHYRINVMRYRNDVSDDEDEEEGSDRIDVDGDDDDDVIYKNPHVDLVYRSRNTDMSATVVNLLLLENETGFHYVGVTNLNNLLNSHATTTRIRSHWCETCLHGFSRQSTLEKHRVLCENGSIGSTVYTMPRKEKLCLKFADLHKTVSPAYVVYADFESTHCYLCQNKFIDNTRP